MSHAPRSDEITATPAARRRGLARYAGVAALLLVTLIVFGDVLFLPRGRVLGGSGGDMINHQVWWRAFGFGEMRAGRFPLWNPHLYGGAPYFAGLTSAMLYPPNWIELIPRVPQHVAINVFYALHVFGAGAFTYACARGRGLSRPAGVLAGIMFMLSGQYVLHVYAGHPLNMASMTWFPVLLLAADRLAETGRRRWIVVGAVAAAMQIYSGQVQYFYYAALIGGAYALCHAATARAGLWNRVKPLAAYVAIYGLGALLAAAQLFPALEAKGESARSGGVPIAFAATLSLPPENFLTFAAPHAFGSVRDYAGRAYLWEVCVFVSVTGLLLAGYALLRHDPRRRFAATMILITLVLALGYHTPIFKLLYAWLPGFNTFRGTSKFASLASLFLALLAGLGLDQLSDRAKLPRSRAVLGFAAVAAVLLVGSLVLRATSAGETGGIWAAVVQRIVASGESYAPPEKFLDPAFIPASAAAAADGVLLAAGTAGVLAALAWLLTRTRHAALAIVALAAVELIVFTRANLATTDPRPPLPEPWAKVLLSNPGDYRVVLGSERWANWGLHYGFQNLYGYDSSSVTGRFAQFLAFTQGLDPGVSAQYVRLTRFPTYLNMLRARFALLPDMNRPVLDLPDPLPHALLVPRHEIETGRDAVLRRIGRPGFDARQTVVLEAEPAIQPQLGGERGTVSVDVISTDELRIAADVPAPTLLLITDNYSRFWRATPLAAGPQERYDVMPANWVLRAIPLAAGKHHIRLRYEPRSVLVGFVTTGLTLAAVAVAGLWARFATKV